MFCKPKQVIKYEAKGKLFNTVKEAENYCELEAVKGLLFDIVNKNSISIPIITYPYSNGYRIDTMVNFIAEIYPDLKKLIEARRGL